MKPEFEENAKALFEGTHHHRGTRHLGAAIGSKESRNDFVVKKVNAWVNSPGLALFSSSRMSLTTPI